MEREIVPFMELEECYFRLKNALYPFAKCLETMRIIREYCDDERKTITIPPKELARKLMEADKKQIMSEDIFYFVERALRDAYYQIGDDYASYDLGCLYYYERFNHVNYKKAFKYFMKEPNIENSTTMAGVCFFYGQGCEQNYEKAYFLLVKSALLGHSAIGLYLLGDMYLNGYYVKKDRPQGFELYTKALEVVQEIETPILDRAEIFFRKGNDYATRSNTLEELKEALMYYNLAESTYIEAIEYVNPSAKTRLIEVRKQQKQVKDDLDHVLFESKKIMS